MVELLLYSIVTYSLIVAPSFMVSVLSIVMATEFDRCSEDLENFMKKSDKLSAEELSKMTDKFYDLTLMVDKVDAMFSLPVGLTLAASLACAWSSSKRYGSVLTSLRHWGHWTSPALRWL